MLDKIAENSKAISQYVLPEEDIEVKVSSFFSKIKEPVLANPKLDFPDKVQAAKVYPSPLPDLFKGEQLVVAGRFSGSGDGAIQIEGTVNGKPKKFAYDVKFDSKNLDNDFIPRLWATRRVGYLLDEMRLHGDNKELKDEVTELARKYGIVTPYTAYLINEDEVRRGVPLSMQSVPQLRDEGAVDVARQRYFKMKKETTGADAVADSRSVSELKSANAPRAAIVANNYEMLRSLPQEQQIQLSRGAGVSGGPMATTAPVQLAEKIEQQTRFVNGRNFFQNGTTWVDSQVQVQAKDKAQRVQVQFGTPEYFQLAATNKAVRPWLALGRQVQFVSGNTIYEITE
jgi:Ca-activated chloride channel family protein